MTTDCVKHSLGDSHFMTNTLKSVPPTMIGRNVLVRDNLTDKLREAVLHTLQWAKHIPVRGWVKEQIPFRCGCDKISKAVLHEVIMQRNLTSLLVLHSSGLWGDRHDPATLF